MKENKQYSLFSVPTEETGVSQKIGYNASSGYLDCRKYKCGFEIKPNKLPESVKKAATILVQASWTQENKNVVSKSSQKWLPCLWFLGDSAVCMILSGLVVEDAHSTGWVPS